MSTSRELATWHLRSDQDREVVVYDNGGGPCRPPAATPTWLGLASVVLASSRQLQTASEFQDAGDLTRAEKQGQLRNPCGLGCPRCNIIYRVLGCTSEAIEFAAKGLRNSRAKREGVQHPAESVPPLWKR